MSPQLAANTSTRTTTTSTPYCVPRIAVRRCRRVSATGQPLLVVVGEAEVESPGCQDGRLPNHFWYALA
jgi:hypothetical protein